jgi:WD40 repeat protein
MTDERIDALVRRLDVADPPPSELIDDTWLAIRGEAADARRWDASIVGRLLASMPHFGPSPTRATVEWPVAWPAVLLIVVLLGMLALAAVVGVGRPTGPLPGRPAGHVVFGRAHHDGSPGYDLFVIATDGTGERPILAGNHDLSHASHDGSRILVPTDDAPVFDTVIAADGSHPVALHPDTTLNIGAGVWSNADDWLAVEAWDDANPDRTGVWLMRPDGTDLRRLTGAGVPGAFSPDDRQLVIARQEGIFVRRVDGSDEHQVGALRPTSYSTAGFSPDGHSIYAATNGTLLVVSLDTGATVTIAVPGGNIVQPRLSPDGTQFVFTFDAATAATTGIWVMNADGSDAHVLADDPGVNEDFSDWLP